MLEKAAKEEDKKVTETDAKYELVSILGLGTLLKIVVRVPFPNVSYGTTHLGMGLA